MGDPGQRSGFAATPEDDQRDQDHESGHEAQQQERERRDVLQAVLEAM